MSKLLVLSSLGLAVGVQVPETVEEFDKLANKPGACLSEAINNIAYRSTLAMFRYEFCEALATHTGIERKSKQVLAKDGKTPKKDEDGNEVFAYTETEADYVKRVCAEQACEVTAYQSLADQLLAKVDEAGKPLVGFDPSAPERAPKAPKKTPAVYLTAADQVIAAGKQTAVAAKLAQILGHAVGETREELGKAISENEAKKRAEAQKKVTEGLLNLVS